LNYRLSKHALEQINKFGRNQIKEEWIERTLNDSDYLIQNSSDNYSCWKRISEYKDRALKIVYNPIKEPVYTG
jgi:hypothetical protein